MKVTYNNIITKLEEFANDHYQINEFNNGDLWECVQHDQFSSFNYPLLFVVDSSSSLEQGAINLGFDLLCMDLVDKDESNENEIKSDALQILLDVVAYMEKLLNDEWYFLQIQKSSSLESFTERFDDELTGWKINITLKQPLTYNECQIPKA